MSILVGSLELTGPFPTAEQLHNTCGIYAVISETAGESEVIELGEADLIRDFLQDKNWDFLNTISFAVLYTAHLSMEEQAKIKRSLYQELSDSIAA